MLSHPGVSVGLSWVLPSQGCCRQPEWMLTSRSERWSQFFIIHCNGRPQRKWKLLPFVSFFFLYLMLYLNEEKNLRHTWEIQANISMEIVLNSFQRKKMTVLIGSRSAKLCWDPFLPRSLLAAGWANAKRMFLLWPFIKKVFKHIVKLKEYYNEHLAIIYMLWYTIYLNRYQTSFSISFWVTWKWVTVCISQCSILLKYYYCGYHILL